MRREQRLLDILSVTNKSSLKCISIKDTVSVLSVRNLQCGERSMKVMKLHLTAISVNKLTSVGVPFELKSIIYLQNYLHWKSKFSSVKVAGTIRNLNKVPPPLPPKYKILRFYSVSECVLFW